MHEQILCTMFLGLFVAALPRLLELELPGEGSLPLAFGMFGSVASGWLGFATGWYGFARGPGVLVSLLGAFVFSRLFKVARRSLGKVRFDFGTRLRRAVGQRNRVNERVA